MISLLITIGMVILGIKLCGIILKICGKLLGAILSMIGYFLIGSFAVACLGVAAIAIPIILIVGIISIVGFAVSLA